MIETLSVTNVWCKQDNHDKVYRVEIMKESETGLCGVLGTYGRRGGHMSMHVICDGVSEKEAKHIAFKKLQELYRKGYRLVKEDVAEAGSALTYA